MVHKTLVFLAIFPLTVLLSFIKTLARLSFASLLANLLQAVGLTLIIEYLLRDLDKIDLENRDNFRPINEVALGFGSIMFAFEGISVVLPLYSRMRRPKLMSTHLGVINVSYFIILTLYFVMGLLGYLKFGRQVRDSITLNLPATPLYDAVRAMFTASILLSYPLQFYVPHEIIWKWAKKSLIKPIIDTSDNASGNHLANNIKSNSLFVGDSTGKKSHSIAAKSTIESSKELAIPISMDDNVSSDNIVNDLEIGTVSSQKNGKFSSLSPIVEGKPAENENNLAEFSGNAKDDNYGDDSVDDKIPQYYEYYCRLVLVILTFTLAITVPKLNLLMDLIGSFSGAALCLTIPAMIHLATFWQDTKGFSKVVMILLDGFVIVGSISAGLGGSLSSLVSIVRTFNH